MAGTGRQQRHPSARAGRSDAPETNPAVGAAIMEVVDNQLRDGTPPETRQTFDRLLADGHTEEEARRLIACVVTSEIFDVLTNHQPYDEARYITALRRLPTLPWE